MSEQRQDVDVHAHFINLCDNDDHDHDHDDGDYLARSTCHCVHILNDDNGIYIYIFTYMTLICACLQDPIKKLIAIKHQKDRLRQTEAETAQRVYDYATKGRVSSDGLPADEQSFVQGFLQVCMYVCI
jgi:hypothetical protein